MTPFKIQIGRKPAGRLFWSGVDSAQPGWYLQYYSAAELQTIRLVLDKNDPVSYAVVEAAAFLGCSDEQVQVGGQEWPRVPSRPSARG